jgi:hypothetical protein
MGTLPPNHFIAFSHVVFVIPCHARTRYIFDASVSNLYHDMCKFIWSENHLPDLWLSVVLQCGSAADLMGFDGANRWAACLLSRVSFIPSPLGFDPRRSPSLGRYGMLYTYSGQRYNSGLKDHYGLENISHQHGVIT